MIEDETLIEQGCVRFDSHIYIATSYFRRIDCNHSNMRSIINARMMKYQANLDDDDPDNKKTIDIYALMDTRAVPKRLITRPCQIISDHEDVQKRDELFLSKLTDLNEIVDLRMEQADKERTMYQSYIEVKVCTRLSTTVWDDSVNVSWDSLIKFFAFFGHFNWNPI